MTNAGKWKKNYSKNGMDFRATMKPERSFHISTLDMMIIGMMDDADNGRDRLCDGNLEKWKERIRSSQVYESRRNFAALRKPNWVTRRKGMRRPFPWLRGAPPHKIVYYWKSDTYTNP